MGSAVWVSFGSFTVYQITNRERGEGQGCRSMCILDGSSEHNAHIYYDVNQVFRFVEGIWSQIVKSDFFFEKAYYTLFVRNMF